MTNQASTTTSMRMNRSQLCSLPMFEVMFDSRAAGGRTPARDFHRDRAA